MGSCTFPCVARSCTTGVLRCTCVLIVCVCARACGFLCGSRLSRVPSIRGGDLRECFEFG